MWQGKCRLINYRIERTDNNLQIDNWVIGIQIINGASGLLTELLGLKTQKGMGRLRHHRGYAAIFVL